MTAQATIASVIIHVWRMTHWYPDLSMLWMVWLLLPFQLLNCLLKSQLGINKWEKELDVMLNNLLQRTIMPQCKTNTKWQTSLSCVICANQSKIHIQFTISNARLVWDSTEPERAWGYQVQPTYLTQLVACMVPPSFQTIPILSSLTCLPLSHMQLYKLSDSVCAQVTD